MRQDNKKSATMDATVCPHTEDAHWRACHASQHESEGGLDYEDYAPAYCVGYVGCAQYGGCYEEALPSLCANWVRIKGDSRLSTEQALAAIRAAWDRVAARVQLRAAQRPLHLRAEPAQADRATPRQPAQVQPAPLMA